HGRARGPRFLSLGRADFISGPPANQGGKIRSWVDETPKLDAPGPHARLAWSNNKMLVPLRAFPFSRSRRGASLGPRPDFISCRLPSLVSGKAFASTGAERTPVREHRSTAKTPPEAR